MGEPGFLSLVAEEPDAAMYEPESWGLPRGDPQQFQRIDGTSAQPDLMQFAAPSAVFTVDDADPDDQRYRILGHHRAQATEEAEGHFTTTEDPFVEFTVENPDATGGSENELRITRDFEGRSEVDLFSYDEATGTWSLQSHESGLVSTRTRSALADGDFQYTETWTEGTPDGEVRISGETTYQVFPFGSHPVMDMLDPGGEALTTTWDYYRDEGDDGIAYGELKLERSPLSGWQRYEYAESPNTEVAELSKVVSQFLDLPVDSAENEVRVRTRTYLSGTPSPFSYLERETLLGQEVRRVFRIVRPGEGYDEIVATSPGADWTDAADTLVTQHRFHFGGTFDGEPSSILYPDGTRTNYQYEVDPVTGIRTIIEETGVPDATDPTVIVDGLRTTVLRNESGQVVGRTVVDIASGLTVEETLTLQEDGFGRPMEIRTLTGTEERSYGCCGLESFTDASGLTTQFTRDGVTETWSRRGLTWTTTRSGGATTLTRQGTDGSIVELAHTERNLAGRVMLQRDAAGRETARTEEIDSLTDYRTVTLTFPDGGTRIEVYYPDGRLESIGGTAVNPRRFEYGVDNNLRTVREIRLGDQGEEVEWRKRFFDLADRLVRVEASHESGTPSVTEVCLQ